MTSSLNLFIEKLTSKNHLVLIFLFGITLLAYGNILFGDFVFDDNIFIENNVQIRSLSNIDAIYSSSITAGSGLLNDNFYRPNQQFIYAILYSLFGLSPFIFHLTSLLFHILNGFLVFILFYKLGIGRRTAFFGSLLFLLHPILTESVSYISGLSDPLVTSTILLTILIFLESVKEIPLEKFLKWLLLGAVTFLFGLFSKENQIISLGLIIALAIFKYKKSQISNFFRAIVFVGVLSIIASLYIYSRLTILNFTGVIGLSPEVDAYTQNLWIRFFTFIHILPEYLKMIVFPWNLSYEKPYIAYNSLLSVQSIFSLFTIISGFILLIVSVVKRNAKRNGEILFNLPLNLSLGLFWFITALIPVSGIIPVNAMYLEHWLYLPIIGIIFCFCSLFSALGAAPAKSGGQGSASSGETLPDFIKKVAVYFLILILILFTIRIMMRNAEWGDPIKFYQNEIKQMERTGQSSARIYNGLAMEQSNRGDCNSAIANYKKAISINDSYPQTHYNLARCFENMGKLQEALEEYKKALAIQPDFPYSLQAISNLLNKP